MNFSDRIGHAYFFAKNYVINKGFASEIDWQEKIKYEEITEQQFLHEISWVIIASGLNDAVVRKIFPAIKESMFGFKNSKLIIDNKRKCLKSSLKVFNHKGKIQAILYAADYISTNTFKKVKAQILNEGIAFLQTFPYLGKATSFHLAKNIGIEVAKPDRHLVRISNALGFKNPNDLCGIIANKVNERISTIDIVLWRYATLDKKYLQKISWLIAKSQQSHYSLSN